jgi:hypothetical protein
MAMSELQYLLYVSGARSQCKAILGNSISDIVTAICNISLALSSCTDSDSLTTLWILLPIPVVGDPASIVPNSPFDNVEIHLQVAALSGFERLNPQPRLFLSAELYPQIPNLYPRLPLPPIQPLRSPSSILVILRNCTIVSGSPESRYTRLDGESLHIIFVSVF